MVDYAQQTHLASSEREDEVEVPVPHHQNAILDVEESSQRIHGFSNACALTLMQAARANKDIGLVTNEVETEDVRRYITSYATKEQKNSSKRTPFSGMCKKDMGVKGHERGTRKS
jgi:hypothetical protein